MGRTGFLTSVDADADLIAYNQSGFRFNVGGDRLIRMKSPLFGNRAGDIPAWQYNFDT